MWIYVNNLDQVIWLAENWKWTWHLNLFSMTRVKTLLRHVCLNMYYLMYWVSEVDSPIFEFGYVLHCKQGCLSEGQTVQSLMRWLVQVISSGSTLFAKVSVMVYRDERTKCENVLFSATCCTIDYSSGNRKSTRSCHSFYTVEDETD